MVLPTAPAGMGELTIRPRKVSTKLCIVIRTGKTIPKTIVHSTHVHWRAKSPDSFSPCQDVGKKDRSMLTSAPLFSDHLSRTPIQIDRTSARNLVE